MKVQKFFLILCFLIGLCVFLYPIISASLNSRNATTVIDNYQQQVDSMSAEEKAKALEAAKNYNEVLNDPEVQSGVSYQDVLNTGEVMGYINIPTIDVHLPIYHGTSDAVLEKAVGHLESSSLPVGGLGTHAVLAGHRGLPTARLFTDLDQLEIGDKFYIHIYDETLEYEIDNITTVLPEDAEKEIAIDKDQDYVTLLTCTPYGVNSHRLLLRGHRVEYQEHIEIAEIKVKNEQHPIVTSYSYRMYVIIGGIVLILLLIILKTINQALLRKAKKQENGIIQEEIKPIQEEKAEEPIKVQKTIIQTSDISDELSKKDILIIVSVIISATITICILIKSIFKWLFED